MLTIRCLHFLESDALLPLTEPATSGCRTVLSWVAWSSALGTDVPDSNFTSCSFSMHALIQSKLCFCTNDKKKLSQDPLPHAEVYNNSTPTPLRLLPQEL